MNVLALDCGEHTGYATLIDGSIRSGVEHWKHRTNESVGMKYLRFDAWIREIDRIGRFDLIVYEKPHGLQGNAVESMNGYITGIHRMIAEEVGITREKPKEYQAVSPGTIKKFATGKGNAGKSEIKTWFHDKTGNYAIDDNEADALALLYYAMNELGVAAK
jgi:hypothetical protein